MTQQREKGRLRSGKGENSVVEKLEEAQDEYHEMARLCAFRVKSLKEGQRRSLLAQTARHHAAQLDFFRKGVKALEAVEPHIRIVAEKYHIDCQLNDGADDEEGEGVSSYDDGELSFDYRQKKHGFATSSNPMELDRVDVTYPQASNLADSEINVNKYQGEQHFGRQARVSSYSAPLYPEKIDPSRETQPARKFYSYVLPPPVVVDTKTPILRTPDTSVSYTNPFQNSQHLLPDEKHERGIGDDNTPTSVSIENKEGNGERFSFPQRDAHDGKAVKRQAYSGPLPPSKTFSGKMKFSRGVPISRSVSPPSLSSSKISELHELPRPPPTSSSSGLTLSTPVNGLIGGHSTPLFFKNQERTILRSNPLAPPHPLPLVVPRSFSIPPSN